MNTEYGLTESGYTITTRTDLPRTSYAFNKNTGDKFFFDIRKKQTATFRRVTQEWELGVDIPDIDLYHDAGKTNPGVPFLVFFETEEPPGIKWVELERISNKGRKWMDADHFPLGIIFVKSNDTHVWEPGTPFSLYRNRTSVQQRLL